jgi:hypothetical protein
MNRIKINAHLSDPDVKHGQTDPENDNDRKQGRALSTVDCWPDVPAKVGIGGEKETEPPHGKANCSRWYSKPQGIST